MNIQFIILEKKLNATCESALKEYGKRLSRYCKFKYHVIKKEKDGLKFAKSTASLFCVISSSETLSSEQFSSLIDSIGIAGTSEIIFFIGFSYDSLANQIPYPIQNFSISPLSFSTSLTATVLSEQVYRGYRILKKEPYHK